MAHLNVLTGEGKKERDERFCDLNVKYTSRPVLTWKMKAQWNLARSFIKSPGRPFKFAPWLTCTLRDKIKIFQAHVFLVALVLGKETERDQDSYNETREIIVFHDLSRIEVEMEHLVEHCHAFVLCATFTRGRAAISARISPSELGKEIHATRQKLSSPSNFDFCF